MKDYVLGTQYLARQHAYATMLAGTCDGMMASRVYVYIKDAEDLCENSSHLTGLSPQGFGLSKGDIHLSS